MSDDLRVEPPPPADGTDLELWAVRGPDGQPIVDSRVRPAPRSGEERRAAMHDAALIRREPSWDELHELLAGAPRHGEVWACGCAALGGDAGEVRKYEPCHEHQAAFIERRRAEEVAARAARDRLLADFKAGR